MHNLKKYVWTVLAVIIILGGIGRMFCPETTQTVVMFVALRVVDIVGIFFTLVGTAIVFAITFLIVCFFADPEIRGLVGMCAEWCVQKGRQKIKTAWK